jgi:hypothetical protein
VLQITHESNGNTKLGGGQVALFATAVELIPNDGRSGSYGDQPRCSPCGLGPIAPTIAVIDGLDIDDEARRKIYVGNAERLMKRKLGRG